MAQRRGAIGLACGPPIGPLRIRFGSDTILITHHPMGGRSGALLATVRHPFAPRVSGLRWRRPPAYNVVCVRRGVVGGADGERRRRVRRWPRLGSDLGALALVGLMMMVVVVVLVWRSFKCRKRYLEVCSVLVAR